MGYFMSTCFKILSTAFRIELVLSRPYLVSGLTYKSRAKWKMLWGIYSAIYGEVNVSVEKCVEIKGDYVEKEQSCFISVTLKSWSGRKLFGPYYVCSESKIMESWGVFYGAKKGGKKRLGNDVRVSPDGTKGSLQSTVSSCSSTRTHTKLHLPRKSHLLLECGARLCSLFLGEEGRMQHPSGTDILV